VKEQLDIDHVESTAQRLLAITAHRPWTPDDMRQAIECALELRTATRGLIDLISGRKPGWCPTLDAWICVLNGCGLLVADLGDDIRQHSECSPRSLHWQACTARAIRWHGRRIETAARRHRKRLASGIPFTAPVDSHGLSTRVLL